MARGRKSGISLTVVPPALPGERPAPPAELDAAEQRIWNAIVGALPPLWLDPRRRRSSPERSPRPASAKVKKPDYASCDGSRKSDMETIGSLAAQHASSAKALAHLLGMLRATPRARMVPRGASRQIRIYDGRVRHAIISTAKKNGKTGLCAALLVNHLVGPSARNHRNARLFSSAMSRDQAALTFDAARKMILLNPDLRQAIAIKESAKVLRNDEPGIEYKALSSEAHRAQGLNPTLHIADELGEVVGPHSSLFEALELSTAAQRDALTVVIGT